MLRKYMMCGVAAMALSVAANAQENVCEASNTCIIIADYRLETINVGGLRPVVQGDQTNSVTLLEADDLSVRNAPNLADALRAVPGVGVSRSGGPGALTQVRIRGAEANHTLVLVDGLEISDPVTGETDFGILTGQGASRLEILRGEASSLYGSDAIGGVINVDSSVTRGVFAGVEGGSFGTYRGQISASDFLDGGVTTFGGSLTGFKTDGVDTSGRGGEKDGSEAYAAILRGEHGFANDWSVTGMALVRQSMAQSDPDLDLDAVLDNADRETQADQYLVGVSATGETGAVDHVFQASFNTVARENTSDGALADKATGDRIKASWSPSTELMLGTLTGLLDWERETYDRADVSFGGGTNASESLETVGLAGEYRYSRDAVSLSASVRQDFNNGRFEDATTFRVGGAYDVDAVRGRLRASIGTGVKNPTFTELFGFFPGSFVGNPDLVPERSLGYEIGWDQRIGTAQVSATIFRSELKDEIFTAFNPDFTSTAQNRAGESTREGVELAGQWSASDALSLRGQVTVLTSENETGEDEIRVPERTASLSVSWQPDPDGYRLGGALDHVGAQDDFDFGTFPARRVTLDAYTLVSGTAEIPVTERLAVTFRVENALNEDATDVYGFNTPGGGAYIGLKLR